MFKLIAIAAFVLSFFVLPIHAQTEQIVWETDFKKAQIMARESGKPLLLDFTASWCKPCVAMDKEFWVLGDVVKAMKPFIAVKINFDDEKSLVSRYGVNAIPFVAFADPLGNMVTFRRGFGQKNVKELNLIFDEMPKDFSFLKKAYGAIEVNKQDGNALLEIADFYRASKMLTLSNNFYKRALKADEIKIKPETVERVAAILGSNSYIAGDDKQAIKFLEDYLNDYPKGASREVITAMAGISSARLEKFKEAEKYKQLLTSEFPNSKHAATIDTTVETYKNKKKEKKN